MTVQMNISPSTYSDPKKIGKKLSQTKETKGIGKEQVSFILTIFLIILGISQLYIQPPLFFNIFAPVLLLGQSYITLPQIIKNLREEKKNPFARIPYIISFTLLCSLGIYTIFTPFHHSSNLLFATASVVLTGLFILFKEEKKLFRRSSKRLNFDNKIQISDFVRRLDHNSVMEEISIENIKKGDIIKVLPNEFIPRDGIIIQGTTSVDEALLIGEFRPLLKAKGDHVVGGSFNRDSIILIEVQNAFENDLLSQIKVRAKDLLDSSSGTTKLTIKITRALTFALSFYSILVFCFHYFFQNISFSYSLQNALSVLLLVPVMHPRTFSKALKTLVKNIINKGVLVTNKAVLSNLIQLKSLFFNKTGTLTKGQYYYSQSCIETGNNLGRLLTTIFSLEKYSNHPLATAVSTHPWYNEITIHEVKDAKYKPGLGVSGTIQPKHGKSYFAAVGNLRFLKRMQFYISKELKSKIDDLESIGETVILCGYNRQIKGLISFSDTLRKNVKDTLHDLKDMGIEICLLTGDTDKAVTQLTGTLGIKKTYSRCIPQEKISAIQKHKEKQSIVGLVGNKITSDNRPKEIDILISTNTGTNISNHPADIIVMGSNFRLISALISKTKKLFLHIQQTQRWLILYPLLFVIPCSLGMIHPLLSGTLSMILGNLGLQLATNPTKLGKQQKQ